MTSFAIKHEFPGYIRFGISAMKHRVLGADLQSTFFALSGVNEIKINPVCNSLLLRYNTDTVSREDLIERLEDYLAEHATLVAKDSCCDVIQTPSPVKKELKRFAGITAVTLGIFVRQSVLGLKVSQSLLSPIGLLTLGLSAPVIMRGMKSIQHKRPNMDSFLAGGIAASLVGGEALTALEILWINAGADTLSTWIKDRSRKHISEIVEIASPHAFVIKDGVEVECEVSQLNVGDIVALHTGEKISIDGTVVWGEGVVNEAPITGHQELQYKQEGGQVFAGTFVQQGVIHVAVDSVGDHTYLARIMAQVEDELAHRSPIEGVADRLAERVLKLGVLSTGVTYLLTGSFMRAYTVLLVMACPCATVLAASTAISSAMNAAARKRILIKGGRYLEEIGKCKTAFFDKTGTLTTTMPHLVDVALLDGVTQSQLVQLAVSAEAHNDHPLAQAILAEAQALGVFPMPHKIDHTGDYHVGMGMRAVLDKCEILVGNRKLLERYDVPVSLTESLEAQLTDFKDRGLTVLYVCKDGKLQGLLGFEATLRPEVKEVFEALRDAGVERLVLLTGDEAATAQTLAKHLGMDAYHASLMPEDKGVIIDAERQQNHPVVMIGDGINDALALAQADVGVAFGTDGSQVAIEAADIALVKADLTGLVQVYHLSQKTLTVVNENFWIATGSNMVGVILGALGILTPVTAGLVHIGHSLGVLANSARLLALPAAQSNNAQTPAKETQQK